MNLNNNKGAVLIISAFVIMLSSVLVIGFLETATTDIEISRNQKNDVIVTYIADAGVEAAVLDLLNKGDGNIARTEFTVGSNSYYYTATQTARHGNRYTIQSLGEYGSFQRTIEARIRVTGKTAVVQYWKEV